MVMNQKILTIALVVLTVVAVGGVAGAGIIYVGNLTLEAQFQSLASDYATLLDEYNALVANYSILTGEYSALDDAYNTLYSDYASLLSAYNDLSVIYDNLNTRYYELCAWIRGQTLPNQVAVWMEAVRRVYLPDYLSGYSDKEYWKQFAKFTRDVVLHASGQVDLFSDVSSAISGALSYGTNTMYLADRAMAILSMNDGAYFAKFPEYWGWGIGSEVWGIETIVADCYGNIDYEYDDDITTSQEYFAWDYIKHPVETAFRTYGDCEDQAILCASYLENCYFVNATGNFPYETAVAIIHDPSHPTYGALYHGVLLVHVEDTTDFWSRHPTTSLWRFGSSDPYYPDYTWCWCDPTWDTPFGVEPAWLPPYGGSISFSVVSIAFCEQGGTVL